MNASHTAIFLHSLFLFSFSSLFSFYFYSSFYRNKGFRTYTNNKHERTPTGIRYSTTMTDVVTDARNSIQSMECVAVGDCVVRVIVWFAHHPSHLIQSHHIPSPSSPSIPLPSPSSPSHPLPLPPFPGHTQIAFVKQLLSLLCLSPFSTLPTVLSLLLYSVLFFSFPFLSYPFLGELSRLAWI